MLYRTVIIEDDSVITHLNRRYVEMDNRFVWFRLFPLLIPLCSGCAATLWI